MTRDEFLNDPYVRRFVDWLAANDERLGFRIEPSPRARFNGGRPFSADGLEAALAGYRRPADVVLPVLEGDCSAAWARRRCADWETTVEMLEELREGLAAALAADDAAAALAWCAAILDWGVKGRGEATLRRLRGVRAAGALPIVLRELAALIGDETVSDPTTRFAAATAPLGGGRRGWMSSGLAKTITVLDERAIIYDSRVAAALGQIVCLWIIDEDDLMGVPQALRFSWSGGHGGKRRPALCARDEHPRMERDVRWFDDQRRASWLARAVLERDPALFGEVGGPTRRLRALEAALFVVGYDVTGHVLLWPSFGFALAA